MRAYSSFFWFLAKCKNDIPLHSNVCYHFQILFSGTNCYYVWNYQYNKHFHGKKKVFLIHISLVLPISVSRSRNEYLLLSKWEIDWETGGSRINQYHNLCKELLCVFENSRNRYLLSLDAYFKPPKVFKIEEEHRSFFRKKENPRNKMERKMTADENGRILIKDVLMLPYLMKVQWNFRGTLSFSE